MPISSVDWPDATFEVPRINTNSNVLSLEPTRYLPSSCHFRDTYPTNQSEEFKDKRQFRIRNQRTQVCLHCPHLTGSTWNCGLFVNLTARANHNDAGC